MTRSPAAHATSAALALLAASALGCSVKSSLYCEKHPDDTVNCPAGSGSSDGGIDASHACHSGSDCAATPATPACDTAAGTCVQCIDDSTCAGTAPTCGSDDRCHACTANAQCTASLTCLDDGSCAAATDVAYVKSTGSGSACSFDAPCGDAVLAIGTGRPIVRVLDTVTTRKLDIQASVELRGDPGTSVLVGQDNPLMQVGAGTLRIDGLRLQSNLATGHSGIVVSPASTPDIVITRSELLFFTGIALNATSGTLTMSRCKVWNNAGGGLSLGTLVSPMVFHITNTFFTNNGGPGNVGAATLGPDTGSQFEFNTIADNANKGTAPIAAGVDCSGSLVLDNNLFAANTHVGGGSANTSGTCTFGAHDLTNGSDGPFAFVNPSPGSDGDYHIGSGSIAIDAGSGSDVTIDFDGQVRPNGPAPDVGADEFYAP